MASGLVFIAASEIMIHKVYADFIFDEAARLIP